MSTIHHLRVARAATVRKYSLYGTAIQARWDWSGGAGKRSLIQTPLGDQFATVGLGETAERRSFYFLGHQLSL
jgi:hypothetical protein